MFYSNKKKKKNEIEKRERQRKRKGKIRHTIIHTIAYKSRRPAMRQYTCVIY